MTLLTTRQQSVFQRAVQRRSRGQVRLPALDLGRCDAIALWQNLVAAFANDGGNGRGRALTPRELMLLRHRAWQRSAGHIALSQDSLTLEAGLALWTLAGKLEALLARQSRGDVARPGLARAAGVAALGLAATQMAACTSLLGGNIKGNFACSAPGGTCAPSTVIDDQALAVIQNARPMVPASGPYFQPQSRGSAQSARLMPTGSGRIAATATGVAHRERRVLKVVFPSYVDGSGNFHEPRVVHTVADAGGWMQLSGSGSGEQGTVQSQATTDAAAPSVSQQAHPVSDPPTAASREPGGQAGLPGQIAPPSGALPDPRVVAEARAKGAARSAGSPVDAIRAEVEAQLGGATKGGQPSAPSPAQGGTATKPGDAAPAAAQGAAQAPAPASTAANPPASFSGKVEE
ncbi:hypothetical protein [Sphingobium sp. Ndbn-10]|uniref:hypothetical protein n=1 Tax=Sphingobium sp. Ndbn-10 TaxID=1667223 RepID=UPI00081877BF|nr:hypothetical protein [Sphingobium sp. Ndbn-10]